MDQLMLNLRSWPQAILHIDGDAFFTSCEEAVHPELKGKPLITGGERGIVACASYAAKAMGIKRGVPLHEARKICPGIIVLPSDYETYSLFSRRMYPATHWGGGVGALAGSAQIETNGEKTE